MHNSWIQPALTAAVLAIAAPAVRGQDAFKGAQFIASDEPATAEQVVQAQTPGAAPARSQPLLAQPAQPAAPAPPAAVPGALVPATPASEQRPTQQAPRTFNVRLAQAPKMLGDFFGQSLASADMEMFVGRSVHHITSVNDFHLIDESGSKVLYVGGPGGTLPGSFFVPGPPPPAPHRVEGLTSNIPGTFAAEQTDDVVDVYNDPLDSSPDIANAAVYNIFEQVETVALPAGGPGDLIGRVRIQDNNSAMPQDRVYFDYSYFHNARLAPGGVEVHRFAPGIERTFWDDMASVEFRAPMGLSLDSSIVLDGPRDFSHGEFGNIVLASKFLLTSSHNDAVAAGLGVALPTADDIEIRRTDGTQVLAISNDAVHLLPYIAYLYAPQDSPYFAHVFLTLDVDANGNRTYANVDGTGLEQIGKWNDQTLISLNTSVGSWLYQNLSQPTGLRGVAWSTEVHYTQTVNDADVVSGGNFSIGNPEADLTLVNATVGGHALIGATTFTIGYSTPLTSSDRVFDGELRAFLNRPY